MAMCLKDCYLNKFINTFLPFVNLTHRRQKTARIWHLPNFISIVNICGLLSIFRAIPSNHHRSCFLSIYLILPKISLSVMRFDYLLKYVLGSSSIDLLMCRSWNFEYYVTFVILFFNSSKPL